MSKNFTVSEVVSITNLPRQNVYMDIYSGRLKAEKCSNTGHYIISQEVLEKYQNKPYFDSNLKRITTLVEAEQFNHTKRLQKILIECNSFEEMEFAKRIIRANRITEEYLEFNNPALTAEKYKEIIEDFNNFKN